MMMNLSDLRGWDEVLYWDLPGGFLAVLTGGGVGVDAPCLQSPLFLRPSFETVHLQPCHVPTPVPGDVFALLIESILGGSISL